MIHAPSEIGERWQLRDISVIDVQKICVGEKVILLQIKKKVLIFFHIEYQDKMVSFNNN